MEQKNQADKFDLLPESFVIKEATAALSAAGWLVVNRSSNFGSNPSFTMTELKCRKNTTKVSIALTRTSIFGFSMSRINGVTTPMSSS